MRYRYQKGEGIVGEEEGRVNVVRGKVRRGGREFVFEWKGEERGLTY